MRDVDSVERRDVTLTAWQLLKILQAVRQQGGRLTLGKLAILARGGAKGMYEASTIKGRKKETENLKIDLDSVSGGPVDMSKTVSRLHSLRVAAPVEDCIGHRTPHSQTHCPKLLPRRISANRLLYNCLYRPWSDRRSTQFFEAPGRGGWSSQCQARI
jgi:hypothetical protein